MQDFSVGNRGAHLRGGIIFALATTLVALTAVLILAKPSHAQDVPPVTLTVDQTEIGFGALALEESVGLSAATRTITVTNTSDTPIVINGVTLRTATGDLLLGSDFTADLGPTGTLTLAGNGGTGTFTVSFDPTTEGIQEALLSLEGLVDGTIVDSIGLVDEAGNTVTGINLSGSGSSAGTDPFAQPGAQGCDIVGTNNGETLTGTPASETICGLGGADKINGRGGNDVLKGGSGKDRITDKSGKDRLLGQGGRDTLNAKDGNRGDLLKGGGGKDRVSKDKGDRARSI